MKAWFVPVGNRKSSSAGAGSQPATPFANVRAFTEAYEPFLPPSKQSLDLGAQPILRRELKRLGISELRALWRSRWPASSTHQRCCLAARGRKPLQLRKAVARPRGHLVSSIWRMAQGIGALVLQSLPWRCWHRPELQKLIVDLPLFAAQPSTREARALSGLKSSTSSLQLWPGCTESLSCRRPPARDPV